MWHCVLNRLRALNATVAITAKVSLGNGDVDMGDS